MELLRLTLACSLLFLAAVPSFAGCTTCSETVFQGCDSTPNSKTRCFFGIDTCETRSAPFCTNFTDQAAAPAMLAEWTVASIEISRPAEGTKAVTSPAVVADARILQK